MDGSLHIRPASPADIAVIRAMAQETWPVAYGRILTSDQLAYMLQLFYSDEALAAQMADGQVFVLAERDGNPVGFAAYNDLGAGTFKLQKLYVLPAGQQTGCVRKLLDVVLEQVAKSGAKELVLNV